MASHNLRLDDQVSEVLILESRQECSNGKPHTLIRHFILLIISRADNLEKGGKLLLIIHLLNLLHSSHEICLVHNSLEHLRGHLFLNLRGSRSRSRCRLALNFFNIIDILTVLVWCL